MESTENDSFINTRHPIGFIAALLLIIILARLISRYFVSFFVFLRHGKSTFDVGFIAHSKLPDTVLPYSAAEIKGRRAYMEDRYCVIPRIVDSELTAFCVCDGHGGFEAARYVTENLSVTLEDALQSNEPWKETCSSNDSRSELFKSKFNFKDVITSTFRKLDEGFLKIAKQKNLDDGTTALCVIASRSHITVANTGDSRALLVRKNFSFIPLSIDHKPNSVEERDRITKLGGTVVHWGVWRVQGVLAVSRAIGDKLLKTFVIPDPDVITHELSEDDAFLVLATDGLWDVMSNMDVTSAIRICPTIDAIAECLVKASFSKGSMDNVTVLVIDLRNRIQS